MKEINNFTESLIKINKEYADLILYYKNREAAVKELEDSCKTLSATAKKVFNWNNDKIDQMKIAVRNSIPSFVVKNLRREDSPNGVVVYLEDVIKLIDSFKEAEGDDNE